MGPLVYDGDSAAFVVSRANPILGKYSLTIESWNSAIFSSIPFAVIPTALVTRDFEIVGDSWPSTHLLTENNHYSIYALQEKVKTFKRMENLDCIREYITPQNVTTELVLVSNILTSQNNVSGLESSLVDG